MTQITRLGTVSDNILLEGLNQFYGANFALNSDEDQDTFGNKRNVPFVCWGIGKHFKPRQDTAEQGVWSVSLLFAYIIFNWKLHKMQNTTVQPF